MLHSPSAGIAFAHYPKTAGHSLVEWFRATFPDAVFVEPNPVHPVSHLPVRESLLRLGFTSRHDRSLGRVGRSIARGCLRLVTGDDPEPAPLRIIGVVREPFEMLVSLFEYWRDFPVRSDDESPLMRAARTGSFRTFLEGACLRGELPKYENFFDVGGPAWPSTRLLDFACLDEALATVGEEWGFPVTAAALARRNVGPRPARDLGPYAREAGTLLGAVQARFRWYERHASRILVRGRTSRQARAA